MATINDILNFWFEGITDQNFIKKQAQPFKKWFTENPRFDFEIREKFEPDLIKARLGQLKNWEDAIHGRLALVILFDQFSRNMYRNTPQAFETDPLALNLTLRSVEERRDGQLQLIERLFLYMPLMHSEKLEIQKLSLQYFGNLVSIAKEEISPNTSYYEYTLDYAKKHHAIIERFGRFPHRNSILNRSSTSEELEFLKQPGSAF